jgi:hypothetical protein
MLSEAIDDNLFHNNQRNYPIDFLMPREITCQITFTLPEGYALESRPLSDGVKIPGGGGTFLFNSTVLGNTLTITSMIKITKAQYSMEEYHYIKELYDRILAKHSEQVVLKKKT